MKRKHFKTVAYFLLRGKYEVPALDLRGPFDVYAQV